jgi:hypothetical protein
MMNADPSLDGYPLYASPATIAAHARHMEAEPVLPATPNAGIPAERWIEEAIRCLPDDCDGTDRDCDITYVRTVILPRALAALRDQPF